MIIIIDVIIIIIIIIVLIVVDLFIQGISGRIPPLLEIESANCNAALPTALLLLLLLLLSNILIFET